MHTRALIAPVAICGLVQLGLLCAVVAAAGPLPFEGRVLTVATGTPELAQLLQSHAPAFKNMTGATVVVTDRGFNNLYRDIMEDLKQGSPFFDVCVRW